MLLADRTLPLICMYIGAETMQRRAQGQPREKLALAEFMQKTFSKYPYTMEPKLGIPHSALGLENMSDSERKMLEVKARYCDALIEMPQKTILIECKLYPRLGPLDGLLLYERLYKMDPRYRHRHHLPVEKMFVYAIEDPALNIVARSLGIRTVSYRPDWLQSYLETRRPRDSRAPQVEFSEEDMGGVSNG